MRSQAYIRFIYVSGAAMIALLIGAFAYIGIKISPELDELSRLQKDIQISKREQAENKAAIWEVQQDLFSIPAQIDRALVLLEHISAINKQTMSSIDRETQKSEAISRSAMETLVGFPSSLTLIRVYEGELQDPNHPRDDDQLLKAAIDFTKYFLPASEVSPDRALSELDVLSCDRRYKDLAVSATLAVLFKYFDSSQWDDLRAKKTLSQVSLSAATEMSKKYGILDPLTRLGNFQRRIADTSGALNKFSQAVMIIEKTNTTPKSDEIFHGKGTELLARGIAVNDPNDLDNALKYLKRAEQVRKTEGQTQVMIDGTRENEGLVYLAKRQDKEALSLAEDINNDTDSAWNSVVLCVAAEHLKDQSGEHLCHDSIANLSSADFRVSELSGLVRSSDRRYVLNLINNLPKSR